MQAGLTCRKYSTFVRHLKNGIDQGYKPSKSPGRESSSFRIPQHTRKEKIAENRSRFLESEVR